MADKMEFPKTMKEFIDSFSFKDSEEVYTNGAELIPVFRVEQGFEHYVKEIRAKAIDEFAEALCNVCFEESLEVTINDIIKADVLTLDGVTEIIMEIAEQMKEGAE